MKKIISFIAVLLLFTGCATKSEPEVVVLDSATHKLLDLEFRQDVSILPNIATPTTLKKDEFLERYFRVWSFTKPTTSKKDAFWGLNSYRNTGSKTYYSPARRAYSNKHFDEIKANANENAFGSLSLPAITVKNTFLRNAPSHEPIFYSFSNPNEGYPFDYLANSTLGINYPVYVSHLSRDGDFAFVQNDAVWGWVDARDLKFMSQNEINMVKNSNFIAILVDRTPIKNLKNEFLFYGRVGTILMVDRSDANFYYGRVFTSKGLENYKIPTNSATNFPATFNSENTKKVINSILGEPYGWGGFSYYRDCSLFTKDYMATFGVWLPRNSKAQGSMRGGVYKNISLSGLTNEQKLDIIKSDGVPYKTVLYMPGHTMLYTGIVNGKVTVTHNAWGLRTANEGRALIAGTAITTLEIGKNAGVLPDRLLLSRIVSMVVVGSGNLSANLDANLSNEATLKAQILEKAYGVKVVNNDVIFSDGTKLAFDDGFKKDEHSLLNNADIEDMVSLNYPNLENPPVYDIGRARNHEFLAKIYGISKHEIEKNLVEVIWLKDFVKKPLAFNSKNSAAASLKKVSDELNELVKKDRTLLAFLDNPAGTYVYRKVAGENYLSAHSYGIAIDINYNKSHYWRHERSMEYKNSIPLEIVAVFEKNGFIWGGRWRHYDTMHFEYRPEIAHNFGYNS
ncbi:MAG: glycoside hydrolase [Campylobacteraceae bacterium]|nr:glycoside hydrolase [Campylobacteraceae bacterium]